MEFIHDRFSILNLIILILTEHLAAADISGRWELTHPDNTVEVNYICQEGNTFLHGTYDEAGYFFATSKDGGDTWEGRWFEAGGFTGGFEWDVFDNRTGWVGT